MKSHESDLKLQAFLDGEMPAGEAAEFEQSLDAPAQALLGELRRTKAALTGGETARPLPESREFFWSKVRREIEKEERVAAAPVREIPWYARWHKHFLGLGGAALVACLGIFLMFSPAKSAAEPVHSGTTEVADASTSAYTYRDHQAQVTMVWLAPKFLDDSEFTPVSGTGKVAPE